MSLKIYEFSVQIVKQDLNITPSAKDRPYIYTKAEPDLTDITEDTLHHLLTEVNTIHNTLTDEISKRAWGEKT